MTTPDSKEAPERISVIFSHVGTQVSWEGVVPHSKYSGTPVEYTRADLVNREPSEGDVERVAKALGREETGLDDESLDGLVWHPSSNSWRVPDMPRWKQWEDAARAAINAWRNP